jgi:hypothetical protein
MKKLLFLIPFFLVGCRDDDVIQAHQMAKFGAPQGLEACYNVSEPVEIEGRYCLKYVGKRK